MYKWDRILSGFMALSYLFIQPIGHTISTAYILLTYVV